MIYTRSCVLHVWPEQTCIYCPRFSSVAILNERLFSPVCPLHGYVEPFSPQAATHAELERQFESIRRFVVWMHNDQGRVSDVSPVHNLLSIPGYQELPAEVDDYGFFAGYHSPAGEQSEVYVVWSATSNQFFLYQDGKEINERACTWVESGKVK